MIRQRVHLRRLGLAELVLRILVTALGLALIVYGAMVVLAAFKLSPTTINSLSAYRTVEHALTSITASDITVTDRIIVAAAGIACLLVFAPLVWRALPRPYLARSRMTLPDPPGPGTTIIRPRALERAAELAASDDPRVVRAHARSDRGVVAVDLDVTLPGLDDGLAGALGEVRQHVRSALSEQGFPPVAVDITLTGATLDSSPQETRS